MSQGVKKEGAPAGTGRGQSEEHRQDVVEITVNNAPQSIHRGNQPVTEIKRIGGIPQADELVQIVNDQLTVLADSDRVVIRGGERFLSQPRDSASSHEEGWG